MSTQKNPKNFQWPLYFSFLQNANPGCKFAQIRHFNDAVHTKTDKQDQCKLENVQVS